MVVFEKYNNREEQKKEECPTYVSEWKSVKNMKYTLILIMLKLKETVF